MSTRPLSLAERLTDAALYSIPRQGPVYSVMLASIRATLAEYGVGTELLPVVPPDPL